MAVGTREPDVYWEQAGLALLWFGMLAGPAAVALNMGAGYALVKWACRSGHGIVLTVIAVASLALALTGAWVSWSCCVRLQGANEHGGRIVDRSYFIAITATGFALLNALLIVMQAYPRFVLSLCE
jgi:hypothetical protein